MKHTLVIAMTILDGQASIGLTNLILTQFVDKKIQPTPVALKRMYDAAYKSKSKYKILHTMTDPSKVNFEELSARIINDYSHSW